MNIFSKNTKVSAFFVTVPIQTALKDATSQGGTGVEPTPQCCACGEARYKMHFQGLWSRQTHPKGFPIDQGTSGSSQYSDSNKEG